MAPVEPTAISWEMFFRICMSVKNTKLDRVTEVDWIIVNNWSAAEATTDAPVYLVTVPPSGVNEATCLLDVTTVV